MSNIATITRKITALNGKIALNEKSKKSDEREFAKYGNEGYTLQIQKRNARIEVLRSEIKSLESEIERIVAGEQSIAGIVEAIKTETIDMLENYIEQTKVFAAKVVERNLAKRERYYQIQSCRHSREYYELQKFVHSTPSAMFSVTPCTELMVKQAIEHYDDSIAKLAYRILGEGMEQKNLKVVYSRIDVNVTCTITDGIKTATAKTIIASGEIQRPHYRFLVHVK